MGKHRNNLPGFHTPKIDPVNEQILRDIIAEAMPLEKIGVMFHPATLAVYVIGRHPLGINRTVVKVPLSIWLGASTGILTQVAVPMLDHAEKIGLAATEPPPDQPAS